MLFVFVGGSPRALAVSAGIFVLSLLLRGHNSFDYQWADPDMEVYPERLSRNRPAPAPRQTSFSYYSWGAVGALVGCLIYVAVSCPSIAALHPRLTQLRNFAAGLVEMWTQLFLWLQQALLGQQGGGAHGQRQARRPTAAQTTVNSLLVETFVSEEDLHRWSAGQLKEELRQLQRQAEFRCSFSGGSEARATHRLLKGGGAVEKQELVHAVLIARGGESGSSCAVCLTSYESGDKLRVLPCGHRFHCDCVDRWLLQQSNSCPLCSKKV